MKKIAIETTKPVNPMIYAYTTPEVVKHEGWTKIGYTEQDVIKRIEQQTHTEAIKLEYNVEWKGNALYEDGSGSFRDHEFHAYLKKLGIPREAGSEWFFVTGPVSKGHFYDFRENKGILSVDTVIPYKLRAEQDKAVTETVAYKENNSGNEFLWNAKPRFGKTLSVYDFCKRVSAKSVLIVTNRPAIANSWYSDYVTFMGDESGFKFVSEIDALKGKRYVLSRKQYIDSLAAHKLGCIEFVSLQDLKGSVYFGGKFDKLKEIRDMEWDVLVVDEAHEGVDTYKTDIAFDQIKRKFTIHLSGTPFKALANDKFPEKAIFNWTYADEQAAKRDWPESDEQENPYANLPRLNLFTYQMSEIVKDEISQGIEINGETEEFAFDLNEFFSVKGNRFVHDSAVDKFLDAMTQQEKYPFSTEELRNEIKHSFWLLNRVESARLLASKLQKHPVFKDYEIVLAAGDGKIDDESETKKSFDKVTAAIKGHDKTITLSVGQLTTGITIPEWTAVLMLSNIKSPSLYMQAAFRAQNPCLFNDNGVYRRKENAYAFDFDPARTLIIFEEFANDLSSDTAKGRGDSEKRKQHVKELLNFFPVIGEDDKGEMIELDAEKVLSIPRKIKSQEVVKRGFMSNYLFQNISNIFGAPQEVIDIISQFTPVPEPKQKLEEVKNAAEGLALNENGDVELPEAQIIGTAAEMFGPKIYEETKEAAEEAVKEAIEKPETAEDNLKNAFTNTAIKAMVDAAAKNYGEELKPAEKKKVERVLQAKANEIATKTFGEYNIKKNVLEKEKTDAIAVGEDKTVVEAKYKKLQDDAKKELVDNLQGAIEGFIKDEGEEVVTIVETAIQERKKDTLEDVIRDHLRGFSRTIPSFLMAYGDDTVTLATFDTVIPDKVFVEVTSITIDQFKFLRDGGTYTDTETGEEKIFGGHLFDPIVFDDSVKEFLRLKKKLADYFDEKAIEDIFDYIPPQKTNQIFTPKRMVKKMVDMLEDENPGCFDMPDKTFIDLYMKSGMYITEIVKRLYQSEKMKDLFPDKEDRLKHIFEKQVYGLAPTEIIYKIATSYILGFDEDVEIKNHNFRQADALPYAKEGKLDELLDSLYSKK